MSSTKIHKYELLSRVIARWGSVVAAVMFGIAFLTDKSLSYSIVSGQVFQILLVLAVFAGYLLAWKNKFEVFGSCLSIAAVGSYYVWSQLDMAFSLNPFFAVVTLPALIQLLAVAFHRMEVKKHFSTEMHVG